MRIAAPAQEVALTTQHDILGHCAEMLSRLGQHELLFSDASMRGRYHGLIYSALRAILDPRHGDPEDLVYLVCARDAHRYS
jgi:hypothetical protein